MLIVISKKNDLVGKCKLKGFKKVDWLLKNLIKGYVQLNEFIILQRKCVYLVHIKYMYG